ncbi:hypothetical protein N8364_04925 [Saprospiraceae bacterium]|nr:hypothetical protein [Saprospiraceae bacterium]
MRHIFINVFIILSLGLSAQWKLMPVLDVFRDTTEVSIPYVDVLGSFSNSDSSVEQVNVVVYFQDNVIKFKFIDHAHFFESPEFEFGDFERISNKIFFKGSDGIASESMYCPYSYDKDLFSISEDRSTINKMLDGGKFLLKHSNEFEYRFAIPAFNGERVYGNNDTLDGSGNGEYDGSGDGIFGRKVVYRNHAELAAITASGSGRIYIKVCIDSRGKVTYAEIDNFNTTIKNNNTLRKALKMIESYRFEPDPKAPVEQCGMIKLFLDLNAFR